MNGSTRDRPLSIAMLALGGQGGGVLTSWLVEAAEASGQIAQSTYVAGVAQRTGATVYCVELFPRAKAESAGQQPVFTAYPIPGDVDVVVAAEMAEAGRAIAKGFVTPNLTTLIASSHRVYSIEEKENLGDGIIDMGKVAAVAEQAARRFVCFDMQAAADETGSVISAVLFGAIAASGALPFGRPACEAAIRASGKAVDANLRGFAAGYDAANANQSGVKGPEAPSSATGRELATGPNGEALATRIGDELPGAVREVALLGAVRVIDFQDARYANAYLDRLGEAAAIDDAGRGYELTAEVARQLALQMCYEDTIRVADLKTRGSRVARIRQQVAARDDQPVHVREYFHPRLEEVCDTLPKRIGAWVLRSPALRKLLEPCLRSGRTIRTSGICGFLLLHLIAKLRRFRRGTYRYGKQQAFIANWFDQVIGAADADYDYALALARCVEIVRGYGSTYERGMARFTATLSRANSAESVRKLHQAALADEKGTAFDAALASLDAAA